MLQKNYIFKLARETKSGKTLVELHDTETLDNVQYWLDPGHDVDISFNFKEKVSATLDLTTFNNRPAFNLKALAKA